MLSQKGSALVFILIGVLVVTGFIGGAYYVGRQAIPKPTTLPAPDETANWKTYKTSSSLFKYPNGWSVEDLEGSKDTSQENYITFEQGKDINGHLVIHRKDYKYNPDSKGERDITVDEWMRWNRFIRDDLPDQTCIQKTYGILSGYECSLSPYGGKSFEFISKTEQRFIEFSTAGETNTKIFQQILSTFKFTDQNQTTATSIIPLATAWSGKLNVYSAPTLGITFQYPAFFIAKVIDIAKEKTQGYYYASLNKDYEYRSFGVTFSVPQLTNAQITEAENADPNFYSKYVNNIMYLSLSKYDNPRNLSLYDFLALEYKVYAGNGIEATFDTFKQSLKPSAVPFPGSYEFVGNQGENPNRKVFFTNKGKIYEFSLTGGLGTGDGYSTDANNLLNNILQTVTILLP